MTRNELEEIFNEYGETDYLKFSRIENPVNQCPDVCAFVMLSQLIPGDHDMVSDSGHDEIFLSPHVEELAKIVTKQQIIDLIRCGVRYDSSTDSLCMFV